jgi:hypothetical protein
MPGDNLQPAIRYMGPLMLLAGVLMQVLGCIVIFKICDIEV